MPLFREIYENENLINVQNPATLETIITVSGDTVPSLATHDIVAAKFSVVN